MAPSSPTPRRSSFLTNNTTIRATIAIADTASWYCSIIIVALILFTTFRDTHPYEYDHEVPDHHPFVPATLHMIKGANFFDRRAPCDEIYVVGEGETLHTISDKCGDPYIVERNPHIHDPDDVFPGLVIRIVPSASTNNRKLLGRY